MPAAQYESNRAGTLTPATSRTPPWSACCCVYLFYRKKPGSRPAHLLCVRSNRPADEIRRTADQRPTDTMVAICKIHFTQKKTKQKNNNILLRAQRASNVIGNEKKKKTTSQSQGAADGLLFRSRFEPGPGALQREGHQLFPQVHSTPSGQVCGCRLRHGHQLCRPRPP